MPLYQPSLWEDAYFARHDFIIAGAGFGGLWCAFELQKKFPRASILLLDKSAMPQGASTRNAGFACFGSPTELISNAQTIGETDMWPVVAMRYHGIEKIKQLFNNDAIGYLPCGGYECLTKTNAQVVADNLHWLNKGMQQITGIQNYFSFSNHQLAAHGLTNFSQMVCSPHEGGLHSGLLLQALQQLVMANGAKILLGVQVTNTVEQAGGIQVNTEQGYTFNGSNLLYCTNAFTNQLAHRPLAQPARGQVLVTGPIKNLALNGTFHFNEGYYYFRNVGDRVLLGGARNTNLNAENTTVMQTTEVIQQTLEQFLEHHILQRQPYTITHRWSGIMSFTNNHLPLVEKVGNRSIAVFGCNGMGVALLPMLAVQVAAMY